MIDEAIYKSIQKELQEGRLSKALDLLLEATEGKHKNLKEELLLLKSKFEYYRNQYEIKGILTDKEFNIHYSKTVLGIQEVLEKLQKGTGEKSISLGKSEKKKRALVPLIAIAVIFGLGLVLWGFYTTRKAQELTIPETLLDLDDSVELEPPRTTEPPPVVQEEVAKQENQPIEKPKTKLDNTKTDAPATIPVEEKDQPEIKPETKLETPPAKYFEVILTMNSDMSDAKILVDGEPAIVLSSTPIIKKIRVTEKQSMHVFELKNESKNCKKELLITRDNQKINFNCN